MTLESKTILRDEAGVIARFMIYNFIILGVAGIMTVDANSGPGSFLETSWVEITQLAVLLTASVLCLFIRRHPAGHPHAALLLFGFLGASFIRECDAFLDTYVFDGCWQLLVILLVGGVLWLTWKNRLDFIIEMKTYLRSLACGLFMSGFLTTYVFSRLFGRQHFWQAVMGEGYIRVVKTAVEECTELLGYAFLLFSVIELAIMARNRHKQKGRPQGAPDAARG
ncbi:hypothetical protein [Geminisphaera colitermitum]|uniref:hypothetical protein n=1 Tax=Geminisphaera colitermitum TaxID=1148786 RepID=UPI000158D025|nr:hypothetical protein [Geminisphaera colitermitum]